MKSIEENFELLEKKYKFDKENKIWITCLEVVVALFASVYIKKAADGQADWRDILIGFLFLAVWAIIIWRRVKRDQDFSISGLGELKSSIELEKAKTEIRRKSVSYDYIDDAIVALNEQTCFFQGSFENNLCDMGLVAGLQSVYKSIIQNAPNVLNTAGSKFSVGAHLKNVNHLPGKPFGAVIGSPKTLILRDDFKLLIETPNDLLKSNQAVDFQFALQTQLNFTDRHAKFSTTTFEHEGTLYRIVAAPIPQICSNKYCEGSIFIICEDVPVVPNELENYLKILNSLFSNWLVKYQQCVSNRALSGYWMNGGKVSQATRNENQIPNFPIPTPTPTPTPVTVKIETLSTQQNADFLARMGATTTSRWPNGTPPEVTEK